MVGHHHVGESSSLIVSFTNKFNASWSLVSSEFFARVGQARAMVRPRLVISATRLRRPVEQDPLRSTTAATRSPVMSRLSLSFRERRSPALGMVSGSGVPFGVA